MNVSKRTLQRYYRDFPYIKKQKPSALVDEFLEWVYNVKHLQIYRTKAELKKAGWRKYCELKEKYRGTINVVATVCR